MVIQIIMRVLVLMTELVLMAYSPHADNDIFGCDKCRFEVGMRGWSILAQLIEALASIPN